MSKLGIFGALRVALSALRRGPAGRSSALLLAALALPSGTALAGAGMANIVAGENQLAAPGNTLPLPITVRNEATFPQDLRFYISFDSTGGALLNGDATTVDITNVEAGGTRTATLTLGPAAGSVTIGTCAIDGAGDCIVGTEDFAPERTATLSGLSASGNVDPGDAFAVQVEAENGGSVPIGAIPVTFTVTGPASPASLATSSNYMAPATLNLTIDPGAPAGSVITVTAERTDVSPRPPAVVYTYTVNEYELIQVSPPDGTMAEAGSTVTLTLHAFFNGGAPDDIMASRDILWEIVQDPSGASRFPGDITTEMFNLEGGTTATIDLTIGAPNTTNGTIIVRATAFAPDNTRTIEFVIDPFDALSMTVVSGDAQSAAVGAAPTNPLVVEVRRNGLLDAGQLVDWSVSPANAVTFTGGGSTAQSTADGSGLASIAITSVNATGPITITAAHNQDPGITQIFTLTGTPSLLAVTVASGDNQSAPVGAPLPNPLVVDVTRNGTEAPGEQINWSVSPAGAVTFTGGGSTATTTSDPGGAASISVTSVNTTGPITITATHAVDSAVSTTFTATGTAAVLGVTVASGDNQSAAVGTPLTNPLVVNVTRNGTPASGEQINWSVSPAGAVTFTGGASTATTTSDPGGAASIAVTSVNTTGPITVTATHALDSTASTTFTVTGTAAVLGVTVASGDNQSAATGTALTNPLVVNVTRNGTPSAGEQINWSVSPAGAVTFTGGGSVATSTSVAGGTASISVTSVNTTGAITITATHALDATAFATFSVTGTAAALGFDTPTGGNQFALPNQPFPQPLRLRTTRNGTAEAGALIDWSVSPAGGLILSADQTTTDASGFTQITVTAGSTGGTYTVFARRNDNPATVFSFTLTVADKRLIKPSTSGDGQTGSPGQALAQPLVAQATLNGSPESNVPVSWTVTGGDATITSTSGATTDNGGFSSAQVTFGPSAGTVTVQATRTDVSGQIQTYTLTALATRTLEKPATGSGDGQSGLIGTTLPERLVVLARDNGVLAPGVTVLWSVTGNATLSSSQTVTGADGSTSVQVTFGNSPGTVTVRAVRADDTNATSTFVLTATSITSPSLTLEKPAGSGDGTAASAGSNVTLSARALIGTSPQADIEVVWELVSGSATLQSSRSFTDSMGLATTVVTLGPSAGAVVVRAVRTDSGASQTYQLTTVSNTAALLEVLEGNGQTGEPGSTALPLRVRYSDGGQPLANSTITWQVLSGGATLSGTTSRTNAQGIAEIGLVFGTTPGEVQVRASAGNATALFTLRVGTPGFLLQVISGNRQTGPVGSRAAAPIVVELSDGLGGVLSGQTINWTVLSGSATLDSAATTSGADGRSSQGFRFGNTAGPIRIRAELPGLQPAVFVDIEATSFVPTLSIVSGNNQSAAAGATLPQDFVVAIAGPAGTSLAGTTINWQVTGGGGTLASATSVTGSDGRATNRLTLGSSSAQQTVTASIAGGPSVTFTASVTTPAGALTLFSGNNQTLPTRTNSAPLVVELKNTAGVPIRGASLLWSGNNVQLASTRTTTDELGQSSNVAQVLLPGAASVTVVVEGGSGSTSTPVVFTLTGGVANIPQLGELQETIGGAVDVLCPALVTLANPTPEQIDLRARCLELVNNAGNNPQQVEVALDELREDVALAQANAALLTASTQFDNLKTRIAALRSGSRGADLGGLALANSSGVMPLSFLPSAVVQAEDGSEGGGEAEAGSDFSRWGFFASGIIGRGEQEEGSVTPEYDFDTTGITAGIDYRVNDQWIVGASLGFNRQDTDLTGDRGGIDTDGWSVSGYTTWYRENNWYLDGVLTFGSNDYDLSRRIAYDIVGAGGVLTHIDQQAEASTSGDVVSTALSFGRDFNKGAWNYGPYLRATYTRVDFDGYEEELLAGAGSGLGLAVESRELKSMTGVIGGKVTYTMSRDWGILMPHAQLEWEHEFKDDPQQVVTRFLHDPTGTRVGLAGEEVDTDYYNVGFGLSALFPGGRSAFLYYERLVGSEGLSQDNLSIGVRIEF
jgi:uncharacterized protein YhjY with autotransporter beta-barrel domain